MEHINVDVRAAIIRLSDALCMHERSTGIESILIVKEKNFTYRAASGKPDIPDDIPDACLLSQMD